VLKALSVQSANVERTLYHTMVQMYKVIAFIPLLNQIFDDKNKNGINGVNNNQVYMRGNFEFVGFHQRVFDDKNN